MRDRVFYPSLLIATVLFVFALGYYTSGRPRVGDLPTGWEIRHVTRGDGQTCEVAVGPYQTGSGGVTAVSLGCYPAGGGR